MNWKEVTININRAAGEAVANIMEEIGARGVVLKEDNDKINIIAYYPDNKDFFQLFSTLKERTYNLNDFGLETGEIRFTVSLTHDEDWATSWHKFFKPTPIASKFLICPSWENCLDNERVVIHIDPGMAFGIGSHETTQMCVQLLEKYANGKIDTMLDIGTGTGILSIVAAKLGVQEILGVDIDQAAVMAARENIRINQVDDRVKIQHGDLTKDVKGRFSLIVANLLPDIIQRLLPSILKLIEDSGILILSGIIEEKKDTIISQLTELELSVIEEYKNNEWINLVARKG